MLTPKVMTLSVRSQGEHLAPPTWNRAMNSLSRPLILALACGLAGLAGGCAAQDGAPAPHPAPPPHMVGGACGYYPHEGSFVVTRVEPASSNSVTVHFAFHLPAGQPPSWGGEPDTGGMNQNVARFEGDLTGAVTSPAPAVGATFPGTRREEIHGTCTPWGYHVSIGGADLSLQPAS